MPTSWVPKQACTRPEASLWPLLKYGSNLLEFRQNPRLGVATLQTIFSFLSTLWNSNIVNKRRSSQQYKNKSSSAPQLHFPTHTGWKPDIRGGKGAAAQGWACSESKKIADTCRSWLEPNDQSGSGCGSLAVAKTWLYVTKKLFTETETP